MADYKDAKVHDWWRDKEFNEYYTIIETLEGQLRIVITKVEAKNE